jgi:hypothetical protein
MAVNGGLGDQECKNQLFVESQYLKRLRSRIDSAFQLSYTGTLRFEISFPLERVVASESLEPVHAFKESLYVIRCNEDSAELKNAFTRFKEISERACSKVNANVSNVLYVGSSSTSLRKRLLEHFGFGHEKTYALQMNHWLQGKVGVEIYEFKGLERQILQLIEDALSDSLSPMFGKQGGNGR